jgi:hypothetical protein
MKSVPLGSQNRVEFTASLPFSQHSLSMALDDATRTKLDPNLRSLSRIRYVGACPFEVASRSC